MNYYKKDNDYIASDLDLELEQVTEEEYNSWKANQDTISEKKQELIEIDGKSIRSVRAKLAGKATEQDEIFLNELELRAEQLRQEIKDLQES